MAEIWSRDAADVVVERCKSHRLREPEQSKHEQRRVGEGHPSGTG